MAQNSSICPSNHTGAGPREPTVFLTEAMCKKAELKTMGKSEGEKSITLLRVREAKGEPFRCSSDVYEMMKDEAKADRECCWVLHVNGKNKVIEKELVSMGTVDHSIVHPREVFRKALIVGASAIVIVHNHPSGDVSPSKADIECSTNLLKASEILGVRLLDFIIIGDGHKSFLDDKIGGFE